MLLTDDNNQSHITIDNELDEQIDRMTSIASVGFCFLFGSEMVFYMM